MQKAKKTVAFWPRRHLLSPHHRGALRKKGTNGNSHIYNIGFTRFPLKVSALCGNPTPTDCWLWISGPRHCEIAEGTRGIRPDPSGHRCSGPSIDGLAHNRNGNSQWHCHLARCLRYFGEHSSHRFARGSDLHGSYAVWFQFNQAAERELWEGTVRTTGIRVRSSLHRRHGDTCAAWSNPLVRRQPSIAGAVVLRWG